MHIGREQRTDTLIDEMLAHDAEQVVLGMRKQLFRLRAAEPIDQLLARHRRVVEKRNQQRPHFLAIGMPEPAEGFRVLPGKTRERGAGLVCVFDGERGYGTISTAKDSAGDPTRIVGDEVPQFKGRIRAR